MSIKWKFWEKPIHEEIKQYKVGSFLFATDINSLRVLSIERKDGMTELKFRRPDGDISMSNGYHRFDLTDAQHEDFISKLSKDIKCIVVQGDNK